MTEVLSAAAAFKDLIGLLLIIGFGILSMSTAIAWVRGS